jgi:hypothetical protein
LKTQEFNSEEIDAFRYKIVNCSNCIIKRFHKKIPFERYKNSSRKTKELIRVNGCALDCIDIFACLDDKFVTNNYVKINDYLIKFNNDKSDPNHLACMQGDKENNSETKGTCINFFYFLYEIHARENLKKILLDIE